MIINNPVKIDRKCLQNPPALQNQISLNHDSGNSQCFTKIIRKLPKHSKSKPLRNIDSIDPGLRDEMIRPMKRKCLLQDQVFDQKTGIDNNCSQSKRHRNENYVTEIVEADVEITTEKTVNRPENATAILERGEKFTTESLTHATEGIISTNIKHSNAECMVANETIQSSDQRLFSSRKDKQRKRRSIHRRQKSGNKENVAPKIHLAKRTPIKRRSSTRYPDSDNHLDSSKKRNFVDLHDECPRPIKINNKTRRKSSSKSTFEREPSTFEEFVQDVHDISTVTKMFIRKAPEFEQELKIICMAVLIDFSGPIKKLRSL
ncbi:uncharacterized protein [Clytia hemisphaerica]|uniref:Uncharacterized protein n=1 Tax=Clytia hemisphaerica TaxID=252671 RepID=A0A7M5V1C5_9CNID|eukprot:TCONS_00038198-protein